MLQAFLVQLKDLFCREMDASHMATPLFRSLGFEEPALILYDPNKEEGFCPAKYASKTTNFFLNEYNCIPT
jgi:hypothetical protein